MGRFIARRLLLSCISLLGATFIASGLLQLSGDPVALMFQSGVADTAQVEALRHELHLDQPMPIQFARFLAEVAPGDLGESLRFRRPATELIMERLPATLSLAFAAMLFALVVAIPSAIASAVRPGHVASLLGRGVSGWVSYARVVRSELLFIRETEYFTAARAIGARAWRIAWKYLLPATRSLIIVTATIQLADAVLLSAGLSCLGVGLQPPAVSWGTMLADGRDDLTTAWWVSTIPGLAITSLILAVNVMGD